MGKNKLSRDSYTVVQRFATAGGTRQATHQAEQTFEVKGLDPLVDPKGPAHLGPIRRSLPRFDKQGDLWMMTLGVPMAEETTLDTTGSMAGNVDKAFASLPESYNMYTSGNAPVLGRYDVQIATGTFGDVGDVERYRKPVLCRSQFEMAEKIALQMSMLVPTRGGLGNNKEDPQFALFGKAYLTQAAINWWGLKYYDFTISDEPVVEVINYPWLKKIFGDDVLDYVEQNGYSFEAGKIPNTAAAVAELQKHAHAFFLQVDKDPYVTAQWRDLFGDDHFVMLPNDTSTLHFVKAAIIGLTEGVLDLSSTKDFLLEHGATASDADQIVRAIAHIPIGAQAMLPNFGKLPKAGDLFKEKTDLWPVDSAEVASATTDESEKPDKPSGWL